MSRVAILKESRDSSSVKFLQFTRIVSKGKIAFFFEGEDEKYYSIRINNIRPDISWCGVNCNGKSKVISMRENIRNHSTYKSYPCLFFVDADFDDNNDLNDFHDVYVTPCYSIENLFISEDSFAQVLSAEFGLSDTCDERDCFALCLSRYKALKSQYLEVIEGFNLMINEIRHLEKSNKSQGRLNLNNLNFDSLVQIELAGVNKLYNETLPKSIFPELPEGLQINFDRSRQHFESKDKSTWYRGKQNLEFYRVFLSKLKIDRCRKDGREIFRNKGNVKIQLTKANIISELSQYAETPSCLRLFLERFDANMQAA